MQVRVVTDSLADIPEKIANDLGIAVVPCLVRFGEKVYRDKVDLTAAEFYQQLASSPILPSTSQASPGAFLEVYRGLLEETHQIYSLHAVASLTGMYNSANIAAAALRDAEPLGVEIEVVDSKQVSMAEGWLAIMAARAARYGATLDEIKQLTQDAISRTHIIAMLDTLEYVVRGGRLGKGSALLGNLLNVKPILSIVNGEVNPVEKVRTQKRAIERIADIALQSGPIQEMAIVHAAAPEMARELRDHFTSTWFEEELIIAETGPVIGTHTGPGAVGVAWVNGQY